MNNIITLTDSYKVTHGDLLPANTEYVYSYFECRAGSKFNKTPFVGLQAILKKYFIGQVVTKEKIDHAEMMFSLHFGNSKVFKRARWEYILNKYNGYLPLKIRAIPEGTVVPINNVLMTVENTDKNCPWLTNYVESILMHVWYPTTVASLSYSIKEMLLEGLDATSDNRNAIMFQLHDFGFRGVSSVESAAIGGMAHILNFMGTDTLAAMECAIEYYNHDMVKDGIPAYSVVATEHSIMTSLGESGEEQVLDTVLNLNPTGILSVVSDSYNIYNFVSNLVCNKFKTRILNRDGVFVIRPDSITPKHPTPEEEVLWILREVATNFGYTVNSKGYMVLNPKVRVLWGDGIDQEGIRKIINLMKTYKFSTENCVFGCGGGLLQKINRDTQRTACKSSAQCRNGRWYDVFKKPVDLSKISKKGRLSLIKNEKGEYETVKWENNVPHKNDLLKTIYENGVLVKDYTFNQLRENCKIV